MTTTGRGRPYCYPPSEGLGEVVCPNSRELPRWALIYAGERYRSSSPAPPLPLPARACSLLLRRKKGRKLSKPNESGRAERAQNAPWDAYSYPHLNSLQKRASSSGRGAGGRLKWGKSTLMFFPGEEVISKK